MIVWTLNSPILRLGRIRGTRLGAWAIRDSRTHLAWSVERASRAAFAAMGVPDYPPWTRRDLDGHVPDQDEHDDRRTEA
jgi:hypothetical protein